MGGGLGKGEGKGHTLGADSSNRPPPRRAAGPRVLPEKVRAAAGKQEEKVSKCLDTKELTEAVCLLSKMCLKGSQLDRLIMSVINSTFMMMDNIPAMLAVLQEKVDYLTEVEQKGGGQTMA